MREIGTQEQKHRQRDKETEKKIETETKTERKKKNSSSHCHLLWPREDKQYLCPQPAICMALSFLNRNEGKMLAFLEPSGLKQRNHVKSQL